MVFAALDERGKLITHSLKDGWHDFLYTICQAKEAALNVFVIVSQDFIKLVEEFDILLNGCHPSEIKFDQEQESQDTLASDYDVLML